MGNVDKHGSLGCLAHTAALLLAVSGLAIDWQSRNLYFTNTDFVTIDGTAFSWHKIEVINVVTRVRRVLVSDVEQPRGIHVDSG